jgi:hypothetical protein
MYVLCQQLGVFIHDIFHANLKLLVEIADIVQ